MPNDFVHLHTHSEYSLLDGLGRVKDLVKEAQRLGHKALALTDHGVMHGTVEFFRACKAAEIRPVIGVETYQTVWGRPMGGREVQFDKENYHLLLLAQNMEGYRNLLKITSQSNLNGYYYKPRVDHDFLAAHAKGVICTSGCLGAEIPQLLMQGKETEAYERIGWYVDVFGKDNFYIELQEHSIPELVNVNKQLVPWAKKFGLELLATNDVHYVHEEDGSPHDVLLCVQTGAKLQDAKRMRMSDGSYFMKSREQMEATFRPFIDLPARVFDNALRIANMCNVDLEDPEYHLPDLPIPDGYDYESYLRHLTEEGLHRLYGERADHADVQERKERELRIIHQMGFDVYFLIVRDLCHHARSQGIWWNVRGSGAGSLVAYCIGVTGLDPLKNNLIFERFLNPGRVSMPDFDLDFPDDQREEMIRYTVEKYGNDQVAQIVTFGRMKARAAIRDVGRASDVSLEQVDRLAKLIPAIPGKPVTIQNVLSEGHEFYNPELVDLYRKETWVKELLDTSMQLEGVARHGGIHAAAVIVADRELSHYTPLSRGTKTTVTNTVTQYEFPILESIGLLKVDFLGLSTLTVLREACRLIQEHHGKEYRLDNIPFEGEEAEPAYRLLSSGEVAGVFQVESQGMRRVLTEMKPSAFEHIIATISLYRPGPLEYIPQFIRRLHGEEEVEYKHDALAPILAETYGICVSGDALVIDAHTGQRYRLDEAGAAKNLHIQGVDEKWQPAVGRVTHWIDSGIKPVYRVRLHNGAEIKTTADHRLLAESGGWLPLHDLSIGDYIAVPKLLMGPERSAQPLDRRQLRVLAYLLADGSLASGPSVDFVSKDPAMIEEYLRCLNVFADVEPRFVQQVRAVTRVGAVKRPGSAHYHQPNALLAWMRELGLKSPSGQHPAGLRSHEKYIPGFVFALGNDDLRFFLASLWDCDGYAGKRLWHYKTISKQLAQDVQTLLLRIGIRSTIYCAGYTIGGDEDKVQQRVGYQITVYDTARLAEMLQPHMVSPKRQQVSNGQDSTSIQREPFIREVDSVWTGSYRGLMATYGIDRQHFYPTGRQRSRITDRVVAPLAAVLPLPDTTRKLGVAWESIESIEFVGDEHVYDLTVEGLHSFVANNVIVHNCVYQEQIIQILSQLAGYTPGEADLVRRAISKKKASEIEKHKKIFIAGCVKNDIPTKVAEDIYADIEFFARYGFNKCVPGDVEVIDAASGRLVRVEDLYTGAVTLEKTVSCDTDSLKLQVGQVSAVMDNGVKPVYRLMTRTGRQIEATANHPFYTFDGWRLLEELQPGDPIATPRGLPVEGPDEWPEYQIIALGHLLAEGNLCHTHSVYFYSQDPAQMHDYVHAAEQFANVRCTIGEQRGAASVYARRMDRSEEPGIVVWAKELGIWGKNAHEKEIPATAFTVNNRQIGLLLSRMWEGDGHINRQGRSLFYATASERMARQMQHLFLRLGIVSRLRTVVFPYKEGRTGYQLFVTGNDNIARFNATVGCHFVSQRRRESLAHLLLKSPQANGAKDVVPLGVKELVRAAKAEAGVTWQEMNVASGVAQREFYPSGNAHKSGFTRATIERLADYFGNADLRRCADSDIYWDPIESIEYVGEKQTYDLEVPGSHNFIANDILVHNSHAADYAVITVQTAYLKALYPVEYMAALLLVERNKTEKVVNFINECRRMGIQVLPPDVNYSGLDFEKQAVPVDSALLALNKDPSLQFDFPVPEGAAIRFGMAAVKNVGEGPVNVILANRREEGPFQSLEDFCDRVDLRRVNKRALECLIKVGALDRFGRRQQLLNVLDQMMARSAATHSAQESGQISMFDLMGDAEQVPAVPIRLPPVEEAKSRERLLWEKELLGVFASSHPLQQLNVDLSAIVTCTCAELNESYDGRTVTVAGMIVSVRTTLTKKSDKMAFVQLEDLQGQCEVVVFPRAYQEFHAQLEQDRVVMVKGKAQSRNGRTSVLADTIQTAVEIAHEIVVDEEKYQEKLLDVPTFNGVSGAESGSAAAGLSDDADDLPRVLGGEMVREPQNGYGGPTIPVKTPAPAAERMPEHLADAFEPLADAGDNDIPAWEASPFANQIPDWMLAEIEGGGETRRQGDKVTRRQGDKVTGRQGDKASTNDSRVQKNSHQSSVSSEQSPIPNLQSPIPNPQSPIFNLQSPIPNPQSPIPNLPPLPAALCAFPSAAAASWSVTSTGCGRS